MNFKTKETAQLNVCKLGIQTGSLYYLSLDQIEMGSKLDVNIYIQEQMVSRQRASKVMVSLRRLKHHQPLKRLSQFKELEN